MIKDDLSSDQQIMQGFFMSRSFGEMISIHAIHILLNSDETLLLFFFDHKKPELREDSALLLAEAKSLSRLDFLLISVAVDLWCGEAKTPFNQILTEFDEIHFLRFLQAVAYKKELIEAWESLSCLN